MALVTACICSRQPELSGLIQNNEIEENDNSALPCFCPKTVIVIFYIAVIFGQFYTRIHVIVALTTVHWHQCITRATNLFLHIQCGFCTYHLLIWNTDPFLRFFCKSFHLPLYYSPLVESLYKSYCGQVLNILLIVKPEQIMGVSILLGGVHMYTWSARWIQ